MITIYINGIWGHLEVKKNLVENPLKECFFAFFEQQENNKLFFLGEKQLPK